MAEVVDLSVYSFEHSETYHIKARKTDDYLYGLTWSGKVVRRRLYVVPMEFGALLGTRLDADTWYARDPSDNENQMGNYYELSEYTGHFLLEGCTTNGFHTGETHR